LPHTDALCKIDAPRHRAAPGRCPLIKILATVTLAACTLLSMPSAKAAALDGPSSTIAVYAGGAFMRQYSRYDYYDDGYRYDDGYYRSSDTYSGTDFGFDARYVAPMGLLLEVTGEQARVSDFGDALKEQQFTAGMGFAGRIGRRTSWYAEGFYQHYRLGEDVAGCDYSCNGWFTANGGGAMGGFTWPFAERWFGAFNLRVSYLSGQSLDLVQAKIDASVGYLITDDLSLSIGASSQAMEQTHDRRYYDRYDYDYDRSDDVLSHTSVFAKLALHF
jgi:hypothetical protein